MTINNQTDKSFEEIKNEAKKEFEEKTRTIASEILADGTIIEMLFDKIENKTKLAIYKNGEIKIQQSITNGEEILRPYNANKDLLKNNVILFPSQPEDFSSQKELVEEIQKFIHKYLSVSDFLEKIASYYVLFSWVYDDFNELPYLRGLGDMGTGKSRMLFTIGSICYRPIFVSGATTVSPIFRILNDFKGTLIIDEADFRFSDTTAEMVKILNNGFAKGMPVLRTESNNSRSFDVKAYNVFGPKIIATRRVYQDDALESRMITENMNLSFARKDIPLNLPASFNDEALGLRNKLLMFRFKFKGKNKINNALEDRSIEPRLNQIAIPLMSIIDDKEVISEIKNYIKEYNEKIKADRTSNYSYQILEIISQLRDENINEPTMKQIAEKFNEELSEKEKLTPKRVGGIIRKSLGLITKKERTGYILPSCNSRKIDILKKRYGIQSKSEHVNDVNVVPDKKIEDISVKDIPF